MTLDNIRLNKSLTAIEQYIVLLDIQLQTMPKNNDVTRTVEACRDLAQEINLLYKKINN